MCGYKSRGQGHQKSRARGQITNKGQGKQGDRQSEGPGAAAPKALAVRASPQPHSHPLSSPQGPAPAQTQSLSSSTKTQHHQQGTVTSYGPPLQPQLTASPRAWLLQVSQESQQQAPEVSTQCDVLQVSGDSNTSIPVEFSED